MAEYKRPRRVYFVDELPKTATGQIRRIKLRTHWGRPTREKEKKPC